MSIQGFTSELFDRRPGQRLSFILAFASVALYIQIAYFTPRTETAILLGSYTVLFLLSLILTKSILSFKFLLGFGIVFRLIFIFSIPNLSDDFYRFFWDGVLTDNQINPFLYLPREIIQNPAIIIPALDPTLLESLNSPDYYTVYPPVCQFVFWIAATFSDGNIHAAVLIMKSFIFMSEVGSIFLIIHLLKIYKINREKTLFYILNPLVIIELVGNIHFDAFLIFFVLLSVYLLQKNKFFLGAMMFAFAIASKLTPILLLPFFLKRFKIKKSLVFYSLVISLTVVCFLPFYGSALVHGLSSSIGLYFQKFEFNASVFYIVREIGFWVKGWDIIQVASKWLSLTTFSLILAVTFFENNKTQNLPGIFIWPLFFYFAFASIIHPWYVTPLVAFCLFSNYWFPVVWSFTIFLSYAGYSSDGFQEQTWVLFVEYLPVYAVLIYELWKNKDLLMIRNSLPEIFSAGDKHV